MVSPEESRSDSHEELPTEALPAAGARDDASADAHAKERSEETEVGPHAERDDTSELLPGSFNADSFKTDVMLAGDNTLAAPSFPSPANLPTGKSPPPIGPAGMRVLEPGETIDEFEVQAVLGRGAFGVVYLARQQSLDRQVALKVAANEGSEGRTMSRLEHDHIVQVFSESVDETGRWRLLCMQLVPGASLAAVIGDLKQREPVEESSTGSLWLSGAFRLTATPSLKNLPVEDDPTAPARLWTGKDYLAVLDERAKLKGNFDPSALRDRELLTDADAVEATAWIGARLAEALGYAHQQGVLHRDIKPANILVNQYGRPMLADFNISQLATDDGNSGEGFGGTLAFMAPEHLEAFSMQGNATPADVDEQSDIYSLGIVLYELLTGERPLPSIAKKSDRATYLKELIEQRIEAPAPLEAGPNTARKTLKRTLARSLAPKKADRFRSGEEFAASLDGCCRLRRAGRRLPKETWLTRNVSRYPAWWFTLFAIVPQIIGSVFNFTYNSIEIGSHLSPEQMELFERLVIYYNLPVYPVLIGFGLAKVVPVFRRWYSLQEADLVDEQEIAVARRGALRLPIVMLYVAALGWLPGGVLFPMVIDWMAGPIPTSVYAHFIVSFTLSGLIAVAYSFCGLQYIGLRIFYPRFWSDATGFRQTAREELAGTRWRLGLIQRLASLIPLVAALLILVSASDEQAAKFRVLGVGLICLGIIGIQIASVATSKLTQTYVALTGSEQ